MGRMVRLLSIPIFCEGLSIWGSGGRQTAVCVETVSLAAFASLWAGVRLDDSDSDSDKDDSVRDSCRDRPADGADRWIILPLDGDDTLVLQ